MDRFIVSDKLGVKVSQFYLKSNMDRFIDCVKSDLQYDLMNLKSNMDRFIVPIVAPL